jgi:hypothetical protein
MPKNQLEYLRDCTPVMWDGEGVRREDGSQDYVLLRNSNGLELTMPDLSHLDTGTIFRTMLLNRGDANTLNICYGGSYDATMTLRSLSDMKKVPLLEKNGKEWSKGVSTTGEGIITTIYYGNKERRPPTPFILGKHAYTVIYIHRKEFILSMLGRFDDAGKYIEFDEPLTFTLWDIQGCYGGTFVSALEDFKIVDTTAIERMKSLRNEFTIERLAEISTYCLEECRWGARLYRTTLDYCVKVGIAPTRHDGGGAYAAALLQKEGVTEHLPPRKETVKSQDAITAIRTAFFGGRIELARLGRMVNVNEYDIHSAYPAQMVDLPSMIGEWSFHTGTPPSPCPPGGRRLFHIKWNFYPTHHFYPLPYRSVDQEVMFPAVGEGWIWDVEYEASLVWCERWKDDVPEVLEYFDYMPRNTEVKPFAFMSERYDQRQKAKKAKEGFQLVLKICMNSSYGKTAQQKGGTAPDFSKGAKLKLPPFFDQTWAGLITAGTRAELVKAACLLENPLDLVAFATDAIFTLSPIPVHETKSDLGTWERKIYEETIFVQAGVRYTRQGEEWTAKTRGFPARAMSTPHRILEAWGKGIKMITVTVDRFYSFSSAVLGRDLWKKRGQWEAVIREVDLTGECPKRENGVLDFPKGIEHVPLPVCKNVAYEECADRGVSLISAPYANLEATMDTATMRKNAEEADLFGECE